MFIDILLLLLMCIINIDSDLGVDIAIPLARGQNFGQFKNSFFFQLAVLIMTLFGKLYTLSV